MNALSKDIYFPREFHAPLADGTDAHLALTPFHVAFDFPHDSRYLVVLVSRSQSVLLVRREAYARMQRGCFEGLDLVRLAKVALLIPADLDEVEMHRVEVDHRNLHSDVFELELSVNSGCNFRCTYCYELGTEFPNNVMTSDTLDDMCAFVRTKLGDTNRYISAIKLTLIGGEPLLSLPSTYTALERVASIATEYRLPFEAMVITNGQRLTRPVARRLRDLGVSRAQVTLDGPPEIHDQRRFTLGRQGTFARIVGNLNQVYDLLDLDIRMNVDTHNAPYIPDFLDAIQAEPFLRGVKSLIFAHVHKTLDHNPFIEQHLMSDDYEIAMYYALHREFIRRGLGELAFSYVPSGGFGCPFFNSNAFHVEVNGNLNRCSLVSGRDQYATGHVKNENLVLLPMADPTRPSAQPYDWTGYKYAHECLDEVCPYYAMCHAGCAFESLTEHGSTHLRRCPKHVFQTAVHDWASSLAFVKYASAEEIEQYLASVEPWPFRRPPEVA